MPAQDQRLYRSRSDRILSGVCGGLASYFGLDPTLVRIIWALVTVLTGVVPGLLVYLLFVVIIPTGGPGGIEAGAPEGRAQLAALLLILFGALLLLSNFGFFGWLSWGRLWPVLLILLGVALLTRRA